MSTQDQFEALKSRFADALRFLDQNRIAIQTLNVQDGRLLVRAVANSNEMHERIIGEFRRADPDLDSVIPDIRIGAGENVTFTGQNSVQSSLDFSHPNAEDSDRG